MFKMQGQKNSITYNFNPSFLSFSLGLWSCECEWKIADSLVKTSCLSETWPWYRLTFKQTNQGLLDLGSSML